MEVGDVLLQGLDLEMLIPASGATCVQTILPRRCGTFGGLLQQIGELSAGLLSWCSFQGCDKKLVHLASKTVQTVLHSVTLCVMFMSILRTLCGHTAKSSWALINVLCSQAIYSTTHAAAGHTMIPAAEIRLTTPAQVWFEPRPDPGSYQPDGGPDGGPAGFDQAGCSTGCCCHHEAPHR